MAPRNSASGRRRASGGRLVCLTVLAWAGWGGCWLQAEDPPTADDMQTLVEQLGADEFALREGATSRLIEIGIPAMDALERGLSSSDREVRYRSGRLLVLLRELDFQQRLDRFLEADDVSQGQGLPGWSRFCHFVEPDAGSRALFVDMQRAEPALMQAIESGVPETIQNLTERTQALQQQAQFERHQLQLGLGTVTALLFASVSDEAVMKSPASQQVATYLHQNSFRSEIQSGPKEPHLRTLLAQWIRHSSGWTAYQGMILALQYGLEEGLEPALRILNEDNLQNQPHFRHYAMLTVARFGDGSHIPVVERLLDDTTPYGGTVRINERTLYRTQLRDVALATLLHLEGLDPSEYGFKQITPHQIFVFNTSTLAFADDAAREEAILKWREYRGLPSGPTDEVRNGAEAGDAAGEGEAEAGPFPGIREDGN